MSQFGQELSPNDAPALPLWIDGHAYLMMAEQFQTVINAKGEAVRRVPLYGEAAVAVAADSTEKAVQVWQAMTPEQRGECFKCLHDLLARFRGHLCGLLVDEAGFSHELAEQELTRALAAIAGRVNAVHASASIAAVASDALAPMAAPLMCAVDALAAGWGVLLKPSSKAPSALFAMAEIFSRAGFPAGLINCVHGDEQIIRALCVNTKVKALAFAGGADLSQKISSMGGQHEMPCISGAPDSALQSQWRALLGYTA